MVIFHSYVSLPEGIQYFYGYPVCNWLGFILDIYVMMTWGHFSAAGFSAQELLRKMAELNQKLLRSRWAPNGGERTHRNQQQEGWVGDNHWKPTNMGCNQQEWDGAYVGPNMKVWSWLINLPLGTSSLTRVWLQKWQRRDHETRAWLHSPTSSVIGWMCIPVSKWSRTVLVFTQKEAVLSG